MYIALGLIVILWCILMVWYFYPYRTVEMTTAQPYKVLNNKVIQGGLLQYEVSYCKYTSVMPTVERSFVDGLIYITPSGSAQFGKGCRTSINTIYIPKSLPVGIYHIDASISFVMNPVRTITKHYQTEKFEVVVK